MKTPTTKKLVVKVRRTRVEIRTNVNTGLAQPGTNSCYPKLCVPPPPTQTRA